MPVTRQQAIAVAMQAAKAHPEPYMGPAFQPHPWVVAAIMVAAADSHRPQMIDVMGVKKAVLSAAFGINALPELELFHRLEELCIEGIAVGASAAREALAREIRGELGNWHGMALHPVSEALHNVASRMQKPADDADGKPGPEHEAQARLAGLQAAVWHLSALVDEQRALLEQVEDVGGRDCFGRKLEEGESYVIDLVRSHLAKVAQPSAEPPAPDARVITIVQGSNSGKQVQMLTDLPSGTLLFSAPQRSRPATDSQLITDAQITAGAAVTSVDGKPIGRNVAIDVFHAMCKAGQEGGAA